MKAQHLLLRGSLAGLACGRFRTASRARGSSGNQASFIWNGARVDNLLQAARPAQDVAQRQHTDITYVSRARSFSGIHHPIPALFGAGRAKPDLHLFVHFCDVQLIVIILSIIVDGNNQGWLSSSVA